jgi:hypothetical protein
LRRLRQAHDRIADLEADLEWAKLTIKAGIDGLRALTLERDQLRSSNRRLAAELRALRSSSDLEAA